MIDVCNKDSVASGIFDACVGRLIAIDVILEKWLGGRELNALMPDLDFEVLLKPQRFCERTIIRPREQQSTFATVDITPLIGESGDWRILRIQIASDSLSGSDYLDAVTNLPDRRALELRRAQWQRESVNGHLPHALLFLDLDNFKKINDSMGHPIGDKVLAVLAERWRNSLRGRDLIVRYGGDEFVALIAGVRSLTEVQPIVKRLTRVTSESIQIDNHVIKVSVTVGVAVADTQAQSLEKLLIAADKDMYAAKRHAE